MFEHKHKIIRGFSEKYNLDKLVYLERYQYINDAIKREKNLKKRKRDWKIKLIIEDNPNWDDISKDWNDKQHTPCLQKSNLESLEIRKV